MRHLTLALIVLGFVATHTERLRGKNPQFTVEQVCRALNQRCDVVLRRRRGTTETRHTSDVIRYHQTRNARAPKSHKKQRNQSLL